MVIGVLRVWSIRLRSLKKGNLQRLSMVHAEFHAVPQNTAACDQAILHRQINWPFNLQTLVPSCLKPFNSEIKLNSLKKWVSVPSGNHVNVFIPYLRSETLEVNSLAEHGVLPLHSELFRAWEFISERTSHVIVLLAKCCIGRLIEI